MAASNTLMVWNDAGLWPFGVVCDSGRSYVEYIHLRIPSTISLLWSIFFSSRAYLLSSIIGLHLDRKEMCSSGSPKRNCAREMTAVFISIATASLSSLPKNEVENEDNCWPRFNRKQLVLSFWTSILIWFLFQY